MKKIVLMVLIMLFASCSYAGAGQKEELDKLNKEATKKFHVRKKGNSIELRNGLSKQYPGLPEDAARAFLKEYRRLFKLSEDLSEIKLESNKRSINTNHINFQQHYKGVPVFRGGIGLRVNDENRIYAVHEGIMEIGELDVEPLIGPEELQDVLLAVPPGYIIKEGTVKLVVFFFEERPVLAYKLIAYKGEQKRRNKYTIFVDSSSGEVLKEYSMYLPDIGSGIQMDEENSGTLSGVLLAAGPGSSVYREPRRGDGPVPDGPGVVHHEFVPPPVEFPDKPVGWALPTIRLIIVQR